MTKKKFDYEEIDVGFYDHIYQKKELACEQLFYLSRGNKSIGTIKVSYSLYEEISDCILSR